MLANSALAAAIGDHTAAEYLGRFQFARLPVPVPLAEINPISLLDVLDELCELKLELFATGREHPLEVGLLARQKAGAQELKPLAIRRVMHE